MNLLEEYKTKIFVDDKGRIVIPAKLREVLNLKKGSAMELVYQFDVIMLYVKGEGEE